jgi:hypothetical protein
MGWKTDLAGYIEYSDNSILQSKIDNLIQNDWIECDPETNEYSFYTNVGDGKFIIDNGKISFDLISGNKLSRMLSYLTYEDAVDYRIVWTYENEDIGLDTPYCDLNFHVYEAEGNLFFKDKIEEEISFSDWIVINNKYSEIERVIKLHDYYSGIDINKPETYLEDHDLMYDIGYSDYRTELFYKKFNFIYKNLDNRYLYKESAIKFLYKNEINDKYTDKIVDIDINLYSEDSLKILLFKELYLVQKDMDDIQKYGYLKNLKNYSEKIKLNTSLIKNEIDIKLCIYCGS